MLKEIIDFKTWLKREDDHPRTRNPEEPSDRKPQETHMDSPPAETPAALSRSKPRTRPSSLLHPPSIIRSSGEEKEKRQHSIPQNSSETLDHRKNQEQNETQAFSTAPSPSTPLLPPPPPLPPPPSSSSTPAHCCPAPPLSSPPQLRCPPSPSLGKTRMPRSLRVTGKKTVDSPTRSPPRNLRTCTVG